MTIIEESEKASSRRKSNSVHLTQVASALPFNYDHQTTTSPLYALHRYSHLEFRPGHLHTIEKWNVVGFLGAFGEDELIRMTWKLLFVGTVKVFEVTVFVRLSYDLSSLMALAINLTLQLPPA